MLASCLWVLSLPNPASQAPAPLCLKAGDGIRVAVAQRAATPAPSAFDGVYVVADDGAIYGSGFGRLLVAGRPFEEAVRRIRLGLKPYVRPETVFVRLESQAGNAIYLVGGTKAGRVPLEPGLTLRKVLPQTDAADWDLQEVELVRDGKRLLRETLGALFRSQEAVLDAPLQAGDVVSVVPTESLRVWVTGEVGHPGEMKLPRGATLSQALAAAGGANPGRLDRDRRIRLRRGPDEKGFDYEGGRVANDVPIESGDVLSLGGPTEVRVTVSGEIANSGEFVVEEGAPLTTVLAKAGGPTPTGSLKSVLVVRDGEAIRVDARNAVATQCSDGGHLQNGDLVVVPKNEKRLYVMGEVASPGVFPMQDDRAYRLSDAIALASGLNSRGVLRRITVVRAGEDGRPKPVQYNLDEFLKDGKLASNPALEPGDAVYVGSSRGLNLHSIIQAASGALLIQSLGGGK